MAKFKSHILLFARLLFPCSVMRDEKISVKILLLEFAIGKIISRRNTFQSRSHFLYLIQ